MILISTNSPNWLTPPQPSYKH